MCSGHKIIKKREELHLWGCYLFISESWFTGFTAERRYCTWVDPWQNNSTTEHGSSKLSFFYLTLSSLLLFSFYCSFVSFFLFPSQGSGPEDFSHLPPEQRRKKLQGKIDELNKDIQKEMDQRCVCVVCFLMCVCVFTETRVLTVV